MARERFFPDEIFLHSFEYYDPVHYVPLRGKSRIITVELSKLDKIVEKPTQKMSAPEYWAVFFQYLTNKSKRHKINEILKYEEGIAMATEALLNISRDEVERARLMSEYKYQLDTQSKLVHAKREGRREGRLEGHREGRLEGHQEGYLEGREAVARNALAKGFSPETVHDITGLDLETIKGLQSSPR